MSTDRSTEKTRVNKPTFSILLLAIAILLAGAQSLSAQTMTAPDGGETWEAETFQTVTWDQLTYSTTVDIFLSVDGGTTFPHQLASGTANDGTQNVALPVGVTSLLQAIVRVEETGTGPDTPGDDPFDDSNAVFTIADISITLPNGGGTEHEYNEDAAPEHIDETATFSDTRGAISYTSGGTLTVDITGANASANDRLTVTDFGSVTVVGGSPNEVYVGGGATLIGTFPQAGFGAGDGVGANVLLVTLNGNVTSADLADLLGAISYSNVSHAPASDVGVSFSLTVNDGSVGLSDSDTATITINASNDSPVLGGIAGPNLSWQEDVTGAVQLAGGTTLSDPDNPANLNGGNLTVSITLNNTGFDLLEVVNAGGISVTTGTPNQVFFDDGFGADLIGTYPASGAGSGIGTFDLVVTFTTADATIQAVRALCQALTFDNTSEDPSQLTRTVSFQVNDGTGAGNAASNIETIDVDVAATNDAPTLTVPVGAVDYDENDPPQPIAPAPANTLTDPDSPDFDGGELRATYISGSTANDQLTIETTANVQVTGGVNVQFNDGLGFVTIGTIPASGTGSGQNGNNLIVTFNNLSTPAGAEAILNAIAFSNISHDPSGTSRVVRFLCDDGDTAGVSNQPSRTVNVNPINDAPDLTGVTGPLAYTENDPATTIVSGTVSITDPDDTDFGGGALTVDVSVNNTTNDQLLVIDSATIFVTDGGAVWNVEDGSANVIGTYPKTGVQSGVDGEDLVISLTAFATLGLTEDLIGTVAYANSSHNPSDFAKAVRFTLNDGDDDSNQPAVTVNVTAENDAPTASGPASLNINEDTPGNVNLGFTDPDVSYVSGTNNVRVLLSVSNGILNLTTPLGGSIVFDVGFGDGTGDVRFEGNPTDVAAAIATVTYTPDLDHNTGDTIVFTVDDRGNWETGGPGTPLTDTHNVTVNIAAQNDAPTITTPPPSPPAPAPAFSVDEDDSATFNLAFSDVDMADGLDTARVTLSATNGVLNLTTPLGGTLIFDVGFGDGTKDVRFQGDRAEVQAAIATVTYTPDGDYHGSDTVNFTVDDLGNTGAGGALTDSVLIGVTVDPVNDAPTFNPGPGLAPFAIGAYDQSAGIAWATGMSVGPANEGPPPPPTNLGQTLVQFNLTLNVAATVGTPSFTVGNSPAMDTSGNLTFVIDAAAGDFIAVYDVTLEDNGGTANGGSDTSAPATLIIANQQSTVYVADGNAGDTYGQPPSVVGGNFFGIDAFAVVQNGIDNVREQDLIYPLTTVVVASGTYDEADVDRDMSLNLVAGSITLTGNGASALQVDGADVVVTGGASVLLDQQSAHPCVQVINSGSLSLSDCVLDQTGSSYAVHIISGDATLSTCDVNQTTANYACYLQGGDLTCDTNTTIDQTGDDEGIYCQNGDLSLTDCTVTQDSDNTAIHTDAGNVTLDTTTVDQNGDDDALVLHTSGTVLLDSSDINQNAAGRTLVMTAGVVTLDGSTLVESNTSNSLCIDYQGGSLDLNEPFANTFRIRGAGGSFITCAPGTGNVDAIGNNWQEDATTFDLSAARLVGSSYAGFEIEDRMLHAMDDALGRGFVRIHASRVYVTDSSGSIQRGINNIDTNPPADTLEVQAGTYAELVTVDVDSLTIRGAQFGEDADLRFGAYNPLVESVINPPSSDPLNHNLFTIDADDVTINGFALDGDIGGGVDARSGVDNTTNTRDGLLVRDSIFVNFADSGLNASSAGGPVFIEGTVSQNVFSNSGTHGVRATDNAFLDVIDNTFITNASGIGLLIRDFNEDRLVTTSIDSNRFTVAAGAIGIELRSIDTTSDWLIEDNSVDAASGVTAVDGAVGFNGVQVFDSDATALNNDFGQAVGGGTLTRTINWQDAGGGTILVSGGSIDRTGTALTVESSTTVEGVSSVDTTVEFNGVNVGLGLAGSVDVGVLVRAQDPGAALPTNPVRVNVIGSTISANTTGVQVSTDGNINSIAATADLQQGSSVDSLTGNAVEVTGPDSLGLLDDTALSALNAGVYCDDDSEVQVTRCAIDTVTDGVSVVNAGDLSVFSNNFVSNFSGYGVYLELGTTFPPAGGPTFGLHDNSFETGGTAAVRNETGFVLFAEDNWWGSATGPTHATSVGGTGESVSDDVDFTPWWASGTDTDPVTPGFQGGANGPVIAGGAYSSVPRHAIPTELVWIAQPPNGIAGIALTTPNMPVVRAQDAGGVLGYNWHGANGDAFMNFANNPTGASLQGNPVIQATDGYAIFSNLIVSTGGVGFELFVIPGTYGPPAATIANSDDSFPFKIDNLVPTLSSINPTVVNEGHGSLLLQVNGTNFNSTTIVRVNGADRPTFFVNTSQVLAGLSSADTTNANDYTISVFNPSPGGGTNLAGQDQTFTVNGIPSAISLAPASVNENLPAPALAGNLGTTDSHDGPLPPATPHVYSLVFGSGSQDNSSFQISGNQLLTNASFDFETKSSYSVRIRTTDKHGAWFESSFTISIGDVNESPTAVADSYDVDEDTTLVVNAANGVLANDTDPDAGFSLTAIPNGVLPPPANAQSLTLNADGSFTLVPAPNYVGPITFQYSAEDNGSLTDGPVTVTVTVNPVNDPPTLAVSNPAAVLEDAGPVSGLSLSPSFQPDAAGSSNESGQSVAEYIVSNVSSPASFVSGPTVNTAGELSFETAPDVNGTFTFDLQVRDNGGTANGGVDTSVVPQVVTITVTAVNDQPSVTGGSNVTRDEDFGPVSIPGFVGMNPGPADESTQTALGYTVQNLVLSGGLTFLTPPAISSSGELTFESDADSNGSATFQVQVQDDGGDAPNDLSALSGTFTITINPVNDAPTLSTITQLSGANEDQQFTIDFATLDGASNAADIDGPAMHYRIHSINSGTLLLNGGSVNLGVSVFSAGDLLQWTAPANANGVHNAFSVRAWDGSLDSGSNVDVSIDVAPVNDAPDFTVLSGNSIVTVAEDAGAVSVPSWIDSFDPGPGESDLVDDYLISNISNPSLFSVAPDVSNTGELSFTTAPDQHGTCTFRVAVRDNGTPNETSPTQQFTITITAVNDAPVLSSISNFAAPAATEDTAFPISFVALTGATTMNDVDGDPLTFRIQTINTGTLTMNGNPVTPGTTVFSSGQLEWTPALDANGNGLSAFSVSAWDGLLNSTATLAVTVDVAPANDDPVLVVNNGLTVAEGANGGIPQGDLEVTDVEDGAANLLYTLDSDPINGTLFLGLTALSSTGTNTFTQDDINNNLLNYTHDGSETSSDSFTFHVDDTSTGRLPGAGSLSFAITITPVNDAPVLSAFSTLTGALEDTPFSIPHGNLEAAATWSDAENPPTISFRIDSVVTGSLTLNGTPVVGGEIVSPGDNLAWTPPLNENTVTNAGPHDAFTASAWDGALPSASSLTVTVDVTEVNDQPSISATNETVDEDTGAHTLFGWATLIPGGGSDESTGGTAQSVAAWNLTNVSNPGLFSSGPSINLAGDLSFTLNSNAFGSTTFDLTVQDTGGTLNTGVDTSAIHVYTITVNNVNDAPTLNSINTLFGGPEDSTIVLTYASLQAAADEMDIDSTPINFRIESVTSGTLDLNNGGINPGVSVFQNGDLLEWDPPANAFGTLNAFTVRAWDGLAASSTAIQVRVFVEGVNDMPSFTASNPPATNEDAGAVTELNWTTFIAGPFEQTSQAVLAYTVSNVTNTSGNLAFLSGPTVDNNGNLHYQAAADTNGTAEFDLIVQDTGGTASGGIDTSSPVQTFTITVNPVNDAPSFTANNPPTILEDAGAQSGVSVASGFDSGASNEAQGVNAYLVSNVSNPGAFVSGPTVNTAGELSYEIAGDVYGVFTFDLRVQDDGGTSPGIDTSAAQTVTITVTPVNDAPTVVPVASNPTVDEDDPAQTVPNFVSMNPGPNETGQVALGYSVNVTAGAALLSAGPAIDTSGTLTFTPAADANGTVSFEVTVQDDGGTSPGTGVDTSAALGGFSITINPVNDVPTLTSITTFTGAQEDTVFNISYTSLLGASNAVDIDGNINGFRVASIASGTLTINGTGTVNPGVTVVASGDTLNWTPDSNDNGSGIGAFSVVARDDGTPAPSLFSVSPVLVTVDVAAVNDPPSFTAGPNVTVPWDAGTQSITGWATNISAGPSDESGQTLTFNVTGNTNAALFSTQPSVSSTGTLSFTPAVNAQGTATITLTLSDSGGGTNTSTPQNFNITIDPAGEIDLLRGTTPIANGSPDNLATANALTPINLVYTIENLGNGALTLNGSPDLVALSSLANCQAWVTHPPSSTIAVSGSTTFVVQVIPSASGAFNLDVSIDNSDADEDPYTFTIAGTANDAPDIDVRRAFREDIPNRAEDHIGSIPAGVPSTFNYEIHNVGTADLNFSGTPTSISGEINCAVTATAPAGAITPASSDLLALDITPVAAGEFRFTLTMNTDDPDESPFVIQVIGDATNGATPELELFGRQLLSPGDTENVGLITSGSNTTFLYEVRNVGSANLGVTTPVLLSNLVNANVIVTTSPSSPVVPGDKTVMGIDVQPFTPGPFSFDFELITNDADESPMTVTVTGQATASLVPEIAIDRDGTDVADGGTDDIGDLPTGAYTPFIYRIRNEGTSNLDISRPALVLSQSNCEVRILQHPDLSVAPQDDTLLIVGVRPLGNGAIAATLQINNNDSSEGQYLIDLVGTGPLPDIRVEYPLYNPVLNGSPINIGSPVAGNLGTVTLTVRNLGTGPLNIASVTTGNQTNCTSSVMSSGTTPVAINDSTDVTLQFTPTAEGAFSFSVTITSDDPDTPNYTVLIEGIAKKSGGGGGGGDDEGCSTGDGGSSYFLLLMMLISGMIIAVRISRSRA